MNRLISLILMFILKPQIGLIIHLGECHIDLQRGIIDLYSLHIGLDLTVPTQKDPLPNLRLGRIRQKKRKPQSVHQENSVYNGPPRRPYGGGQYGDYRVSTYNRFQPLHDGEYPYGDYSRREWDHYLDNCTPGRGNWNEKPPRYYPPPPLLP